MARATWTSPTGVRTISAPSARAASSTTRLVDKLHTTGCPFPLPPSPPHARTPNASALSSPHPPPHPTPHPPRPPSATTTFPTSEALPRYNVARRDDHYNTSSP